MDPEVILDSYLCQYYDFPVGSDERESVIKTVTSVISTCGQKWSEEEVRGWLNSHKPRLDKPLFPQCCERLTRSISDSQLSLLVAEPERMTSTKRLLTECNSFWLDNISSPSFCKYISAPQAFIGFLPSSRKISTKSPPLPGSNPIPYMSYLDDDTDFSRCPTSCRTTEFESIECGIANFCDYPILIGVKEDSHSLFYNGQEIVVPTDAVGTSACASKDTAYFLLGTSIYSYRDGVFKEETKADIDVKRFSGMTAVDDQVAVASGNTIQVYNKDFTVIGDIDVDTSLITSLVGFRDGFVYTSHLADIAEMVDIEGRYIRSFSGHVSGITSMCTLDRNTIMTGSSDLTAKIWDFRQNLPVIQLQKHQASVTSVAVSSSDPSVVLTGGADFAIKGWDLRIMKFIFEANTSPGVPLNIGYGKNLAALMTENRITPSVLYSSYAGEETNRPFNSCSSNMVLEYSFLN